jgi:hypothetical protein
MMRLCGGSRTAALVAALIAGVGRSRAAAHAAMLFDRRKMSVRCNR